MVAAELRGQALDVGFGDVQRMEPSGPGRILQLPDEIELPERLSNEIGPVGLVDEGVDLGVEAIEVLSGERDVGCVDGGDIASHRRRELDCLLRRGRARTSPQTSASSSSSSSVRAGARR